jgi:hypothetical protein
VLDPAVVDFVDVGGVGVAPPFFLLDVDGVVAVVDCNSSKQLFFEPPPLRRFFFVVVFPSLAPFLPSLSLPPPPSSSSSSLLPRRLIAS